MLQRLALGITGLLIGVFTFSQYHSIPLGPFRDQYQPNADREAILKTLNDEQERLKNQIADLRNWIEQTQKSEGSSDEIDQIKILKELEKRNGLTSLEGKGIGIILDDSPDAKRAFLDVNDNSLVHAADLRDVINLLFVDGAAAIAINGERILVTSPITCVGNNILVNNSNLVPPFKIEALGSPEALYLNILNTGQLPSLYGRKETYGLQFSIAIQNDLEIPAYDGNFAIKNLTPESLS
ncbi:DUF881 domain-containing protein [Candidatus Peregrinibacteria bacterium]|nr:DUF881 domain-containing protein [Candidatus Peregrinibacteria bacterium]